MSRNQPDISGSANQRSRKSRRIVADEPAPPPAGDKTAFPEEVLRQSPVLSRAGLPCVKRMPAYLQLLRVLQMQGHETVSGTVLASVHHLEPVIVRKDLAMTGAAGMPRVGFRITELIQAIEKFLGWDQQTKAVLIGAGNLGRALLGYQGFQDYGLRIMGAFDSDPRVVGQWMHGRKVQPMDQLARFVKKSGVILGVLTVPVEAAQETANLMVQAGIRGIWNFTPVKLVLPETILIQKEDLAEGLAVLSHRLRHLTMK